MNNEEAKVLEGIKEYLERIKLALGKSDGSYARGCVNVATKALLHIGHLEQIYSNQDLTVVQDYVAPKQGEETTLVTTSHCGIDYDQTFDKEKK